MRLTSSATSEGVMAESGPSVVVWEESLGGREHSLAASSVPLSPKGPPSGVAFSGVV